MNPIKQITMQQSQGSEEQKQSKIVKVEPAWKGKWIGVNYVDFSVGHKVNTQYECVYRTTKKEECRADGVEVMPIIKYKNKSPEIVLIANFRPPVGAFCLELPSGLLDDDDYESNMKRELMEETGYVLSKVVEFPTPTIDIDPWKSNETSILFIGMIDGDDPTHKKEQALEVTENIKVLKFELNSEFPAKLKQFAELHKYRIESKLWAICTGLVLSSLLV